MRLPLGLILPTCVTLWIGVPTVAEGQWRSRSTSIWSNMSGGLRGGRDFENHAWSIGAQLAMPLLQRIEFRPSGDYFLGNRTPFRWQLNADGVLTFGPGRTVYGGAGAAFTRVRPLATVKSGYNLFFGLVFARNPSPSKPFLEFRWTFVNQTSPFRLVAGVNQSF
jgi:hypothetical protein